MAEVAQLEYVVRSPETRKKISKLTSDTKAAVLEIARKDKSINKSKKKMSEGSAEGSINIAELSGRTFLDSKISSLDTQPTKDDDMTRCISDYTVSPLVELACDDGIISEPLVCDTSYYCSMYSSILRSRVEELLLSFNNLNTSAEQFSSGGITEQNASDEILRSALTLMIRLLSFRSSFRSSCLRILQ